MLIATLLGLWAILVFARETPVGRALREKLVDAPAGWLNRIERRQIVTMLLLGVVAGLALWIGEGDGLRAFTMATPEVLSWMVTFDIASLVDLTVVALLAATQIRLGRIAPRLFGRRTSAGRSKRSRRQRKPRVPTGANDDDRPAFAHAA